jgi:hypothetical protein
MRREQEKNGITCPNMTISVEVMGDNGYVLQGPEPKARTIQKPPCGPAGIRAKRATGE